MKKIHLHFSNLTYPDAKDAIVLHSLKEVNKAICCEQEEIHTTQLICCNHDIVFDWGYDIVVHNSNINYFTISQDGQKCKITYDNLGKPRYSEYSSRELSLIRLIETGVPETIPWLTI